jgi:HEAT repeat protein
MVRYSATEALGHLGRPVSRDTLCSVLSGDRSLLVRSAAAEALGILGGDSVLGPLTLALIVDPEWRVRRAAAESCGLLQQTVVAETLQEAIHDPHFRVRLAVVWAIREINDLASKPVLAEVAEKDLSLHVRRAAEHALERFVS